MSRQPRPFDAPGWPDWLIVWLILSLWLGGIAALAALCWMVL